MKKRMNNSVHLEGYVYDASGLEKRVSQSEKTKGTEYIRGTLNIATDEECLNVVPVKFTYVTPTFAKSGKPNPSWKVLEDLIEGNLATVLSDGKENAVKVGVDTSLGLNDFYNKNDEFVSVKELQGGFVRKITELDEKPELRNIFHLDFLATGFSIKEADPERNLPERGILKGAAFDFRNELLPMELTVLKPAAIGYFNGEDISNKNPLFTQVKGEIINQTIIKKKEEEGAFGEAFVTTTKTSYKDYVVTWAPSLAYEWDSEDTITANELTEAIQAREIKKATLKQEHEARKNQSTSKVNVNSFMSSGGYNF